MSELSYSPTSFDLADFTTASSTEVGEDEFSTTEVLDVDKGSGVYIGRGSSSNPLQAEGSIDADINDSGNADIDGKYRLVVLNSQNNVVDGGIITQGKIDAMEQTRANSIDGDITPFINKEVREPYKVALQLKTSSGTATYSNSNSTFEADGFQGEALN